MKWELNSTLKQAFILQTSLENNLYVIREIIYLEKDEIINNLLNNKKIEQFFNRCFNNYLRSKLSTNNRPFSDISNFSFIKLTSQQMIAAEYIIDYQNNFFELEEKLEFDLENLLHQESTILQFYEIIVKFCHEMKFQLNTDQFAELFCFVDKEKFKSGVIEKISPLL